MHINGQPSAKVSLGEESVVELALEESCPIVSSRKVIWNEYCESRPILVTITNQPRVLAEGCLPLRFSSGSTDNSSARGWLPLVPGDALSACVSPMRYAGKP